MKTCHRCLYVSVLFTCPATNGMAHGIKEQLLHPFTMYTIVQFRSNTRGLITILVLAFMNQTNSAEAGTMQLQMSRITHGLLSASGVIETIELQSLSECILAGTSLADCHAVDYHTIDQRCEIISSHGTALQIQNDSFYIFAVFNNSFDQQHTGIEKECAVGPVKWRNQFATGFVVYPNLICANEESQGNCVCKVTVDDYEVPGVLISIKKCLYVYEGRGGVSAIYRTLHIDAESQLTSSWLGYTVGSHVPERSFIGGHSTQGTPFYVCRAQIGATYYTGYYDPTTAKSNTFHQITALQPMHPSSIELLMFNPDGPVTSGPTVGYPCPRSQVRIVSTGYEMK